MSRASAKHTYRDLLIALVIGLALGIAASWPLAARLGELLPSEPRGVPAELSQVHFSVWSLASVGESLARGENPFETQQLFAPRGESLLHFGVPLLYGALARPLVLAFGASAAFGALQLLLVAAAFASAFALARGLGLGRVAGWSLGAAWALAPCFRTGWFMGAEAWSNPWLPLVLLGIVHLRGARRMPVGAPRALFRWVLFTAACIALSAWSGWREAFAAALLVVAALVLRLGSPLSSENARQPLTRSAIPVVTALLTALLLCMPLVQLARDARGSTHVAAQAERVQAEASTRHSVVDVASELAVQRVDDPTSSTRARPVRALAVAIDTCLPPSRVSTWLVVLLAGAAAVLATTAARYALGGWCVLFASALPPPSAVASYLRAADVAPVAWLLLAVAAVSAIDRAFARGFARTLESDGGRGASTARSLVRRRAVGLLASAAPLLFTADTLVQPRRFTSLGQPDFLAELVPGGGAPAGRVLVLPGWPGSSVELLWALEHGRGLVLPYDTHDPEVPLRLFAERSPAVFELAFGDSHKALPDSARATKSVRDPSQLELELELLGVAHVILHSNWTDDPTRMADVLDRLDGWERAALPDGDRDWWYRTRDGYRFEL